MQIEWRRKAETELRKQVNYCLQEFGYSTVLRFRKRINTTLDVLKVFPHMGKVESELMNGRMVYRSLVVHKYLKMIYRVDEASDTIYIVDLWDTRQEPRQLAEETD